MDPGVAQLEQHPEQRRPKSIAQTADTRDHALDCALQRGSPPISIRSSTPLRRRYIQCADNYEGVSVCTVGWIIIFIREAPTGRTCSSALASFETYALTAGYVIIPMATMAVLTNRIHLM